MGRLHCVRCLEDGRGARKFSMSKYQSGRKIRIKFLLTSLLCWAISLSRRNPRLTGVSGHTIQVRQQPWGRPSEVSDQASAIIAMAFDAGGAKLEARESGEVLYNGTPADEGDF